MGEYLPRGLDAAWEQICVARFHCSSPDYAEWQIS